MRIPVFILFAAAVPLLLGDTLTLRNGTVFDGTYIKGGRHHIVFRDVNGVRQHIDKDQIQSLAFGPAITVSGEENREAYGDANREAGLGFLNTIAAGATINVRPVGFIDSAQPGQTFSGVIDNDVSDVNGEIIIPAGSRCTLVAREVLGGSSSRVLGLDLQSVTVNGQQYFVTSGDLARNVSGTALGNLLSQPAQQEVVTRGPEIRVPAGVDLLFQLAAPLSLQAALP